MDTEPSFAKSSGHRRGVAMFVTLGAIVLVSLFGLASLTLAERDQTLTGDINDIKSRDEAALAGLQVGINRLEANPEQTIAALNAFILSGGPSPKTPDKTWIDFEKDSLQLVADEPKWQLLSAMSGNQTAVKIQILAVAQGDTTPSKKKQEVDSSAIYISLLCKARGRRGDEKTVQGTYRLHGATLNYTVGDRSYVIPDYAFYMGSILKSTNQGFNITGDAYIASAGNSFLNGKAFLHTTGTFKWNGNLHTNAPVSVDGPAYISGSLYINGNGPIHFKENAVVAGGLMTVDDSIVADGSLLIQGSGSTNIWNSGHTLRVAEDLVYRSSGEKNGISSKISVGGNAWFMTGAQEMRGSDSFSVAKNLYLGDNGTTANSAAFRVSDVGNVRIGGSVIQTNPGLFSLTNGSTTWAKVDTFFSVDTLSIGKSPLATTLLLKRPKAEAKWRPPPTPESLGFDTILQNTTIERNPMDSLLVDMTHSPEVADKVVPLTEKLLTEASAGTNSITAASLNALYTHLTSTKQTLNGYMVLRLDEEKVSKIGSNFADSKEGFKGKMLLIVEGNYNVNHAWPHSHDSTNIQVIIIRKGGGLHNWGWGQGNFAGYFYWENPPCKSVQGELPDGGLWWGGFMYGHNTDKSCSSEFTFNTTGAITLRRSLSVIEDIGVNLPGVMQPAVGTGIPPRNIGKAPIFQVTPTLRLVHSRPFFEPVGIFR